ncbi:MAG: hypothetical protein EXR75_15295 [Myxococcales bacterium]|nr:hypothetical protein [Myxococcales bacterium]
MKQPCTNFAGHRRTTSFALVLFCAAACGKAEPDVTLAPTAEKLVPAASKSAAAVAFSVVKAGSKADFVMDAPIEQILGKVRDGAGGELHVDLADLTKTTGLLTLDLERLEIFQRIREKDGEPFGAETKQEKQNEHARGWLELDEGEGADEERKRKVVTNRTVQFSVSSVKTTTADVTKLSGAERKVLATVAGDLLLHGHKTMTTAEIELTFKLGADGVPTEIGVKTVKPFAVGLAEHDVRPRDTVGKFLAKGLDALAPKVAQKALVSLDLRMTPKPR